MGLATFIWQRGHTFHFRRRLAFRIGPSNPISLSMKTRDPDRARSLARRLAARWDREMEMLERRRTEVLTPVQKARIIRSALEDELAIATGHWLDVETLDPETETRRAKLFAAAYDRERQRHALIPGSSLFDKLGEADQKAALGFSDIYISKARDEKILAHEYLKEVGAAPTELNYRDALLAIYAGRKEAQLRSGYMAHPEVASRIDGVACLLDDAFVAQLRSSPPEPTPTAQPAQPVAPRVPTSLHGCPTCHAALTRAAEPVDDMPFKVRVERQFSEVIEEINSRKRTANEWSIDKGDQKRVLSIFAWVTGDKMLCDYRPEDIDAFQEAYEIAPAGFPWSKYINANPQPAWEDVKAQFAHTAARPRKEATYNRDIGILQGACQVLSKTAWRPAIGKEPIMKVGERKRLPPPNMWDPPRMPWPEPALKALFQLRLFVGGGGKLHRLNEASLPRVWHDAAYWVPLLAVYTGAAREEVCGLEVDDVVIDCKVPHIWVRANFTRSKDGVTPAGLKAVPRYRHIPLHREILKLGFADYVKAIRKERHTSLFPELFDIKAGGGTKFYARAWQHIVDAVDAQHKLPRTSEGKRVDFHSLRTYSSSVLSDVDARQSAIDRILGHQSVGTGNINYDRRMYVVGIDQYLSELLELIEKSFPVVTGHLSFTKINLLPLSARSRTGKAKL